MYLSEFKCIYVYPSLSLFLESLQTGLFLNRFESAKLERKALPGRGQGLVAKAAATGWEHGGFQAARQLQKCYCLITYYGIYFGA